MALELIGEDLQWRHHPLSLLKTHWLYELGSISRRWSILSDSKIFVELVLDAFGENGLLNNSISYY